MQNRRDPSTYAISVGFSLSFLSLCEIKEIYSCSPPWLSGISITRQRSARLPHRLGESLTHQSLDGVRVACDLMVLFFIYDEFTDKVDGDGARLYAEMVMDAIRYPERARPQGEPKLGEITRQYVFCVPTMAVSFANEVAWPDFGCVRSRFQVLRPKNASSRRSQNMCTR